MTDIRALNSGDLDAVLGIIEARTSFFSESDFDKTPHHELARSLVDSGRALGLFEDGQLDAYIAWNILHESPRSDDPSLMDSPAAWVNVLWTRPRPDREKLPSGHDLNISRIMEAMFQLMRSVGVYTFWSLLPAKWRLLAQSSHLQREMAHWTLADMGFQAPGERITGPAAQWLATGPMRGMKPKFPIIARAFTLKDEFRNACS